MTAVLEERTAAVEVVELIPLEQCRPSSYNPRTFGAKPSPQLLELAMSIRRTGQVQPATVRPIEGGLYEIVAGERRWRACSLRASGERGGPREDAIDSQHAVDGATGEQLTAAGPPVEVLRAVVRELTDEQAMEVCVTENLEREDLQPLEEARGVETMLQLCKGDVEAVASRLSRPVSWVAKRSRLCTLTPKWRAALVDEERRIGGLVTVAHLLEVAKLAPDAQDELLKTDFGHYGWIPSVEQLRGRVGARLRTLNLAPFDILDATLVPAIGACSTCPTTSASVPGLFQEEGDEIRPSELRKARCLNPGCWEGKKAAALRARLAELRKEFGREAFLVVDGHTGEPSPKGLTPRNVASWSGEWQPAKKDEKGAWVGLFLAGEKEGKVGWFKRGKRPATSYSKSDKKTLKELRADLEARRNNRVEELLAKLLEKTPPPMPSVEVLVALALVFGTADNRMDLWDDGYEGGWTGSGRKMAKTPKGWTPWKGVESAVAANDTAERLWREQLVPLFVERLSSGGSNPAAEAENLARTAGLFGIDLEPLRQKAAAEIPEPPGWAKLAEQEKAAKSAAKKKPAAEVSP